MQDIFVFLWKITCLKSSFRLTLKLLEEKFCLKICVRIHTHPHFQTDENKREWCLNVRAFADITAF